MAHYPSTLARYGNNDRNAGLLTPDSISLHLEQSIGYMNTPTTAERIERVQELMAPSGSGIFARPACDPMPWTKSDLDNLSDARGNIIFESCRWDAQTGASASNAVNAEVMEHLTHIADAGFPSDIAELQDQVHAMSDRLFPNRDVKRAFLKLFEEMGEVIRNPRDPKEWGDVFILMFDLSKHYGIDVKRAVIEKSAILEGRVWTETETGTYQHIPGIKVEVRVEPRGEMAEVVEAMRNYAPGVMTYG